MSATAWCDSFDWVENNLLIHNTQPSSVSGSETDGEKADDLEKIRFRLLTVHLQGEPMR